MPRNLPQRKSPRLPDYDYAQSGAYFVTICTNQRQHLFGEVVAGQMVHSAFGEIAQEEIMRLPDYWFGQVDVDQFVVMPNHVHMLLFLTEKTAKHAPDTMNGVPTKDAAIVMPTLGQVVGAYKAGVTRRVRQDDLMEAPFSPWQSRYHDHIIRTVASLDYIRRYILTNPAQWEQDTFYT